jgi:UDPglucose--hexose-1-phosphate uridylyltransferase
MKENNAFNKWEKRWHPLREEWIVYAAHRNSRPWTTGKEEINIKSLPEYDSTCYLCPGNDRIHGDRNPKYDDVFIFENDHPVVGVDSPHIDSDKKVKGEGLYKRERALGIAKVVCYDPRHNYSLADLKLTKIAKVFSKLKEEMQAFKKLDFIKNVLIFENKGKEVGVSNPHPHCQIYATDFIFKNVEQHLKVASSFRKENNKNIFEQIIKNEQEDEIRIIAENEGAIAFIPFFARYAYEVMIFPKKRHADLTTLTDEEIYDLAAVFQTVTRKFDLNFKMSFPYVMSIVQAPVDGNNYNEHHLYIWLQPPLRQPNLIKYLAGPEIGIGNFMADTIPEEKAEELRKILITLEK